MIQPRTTPPIDWPRYLDQARVLVKEHGGYAPAAAVLTAQIGRLVSRDTLRAAILRYEERDPGIKHPDEAGSGQGGQDGAVSAGSAKKKAPGSEPDAYHGGSTGPARSSNDPPPVNHAGLRDTIAPAVHTSKSRAEAHLIISDPQLPYQHPGALRFCQRVRTEFGIPLENVLCVGDEFDLYFASRFDKSPEAPHTAKQEIEAGREEVARWVAAFPRLRICYSNHGARLRAAAHRANLPVQLVRNIREVYNLPETWQYADHWIVKASKAPFRVEHGHVGPGGHSGLRGRPLNRMISTAWGHEHAEPGVVHVDTHGGGQLWGMRTGSLISKDPLPAFEYNGDQGSRPVGSVGVVLDGGRLPLIVRM